ncbi:unnamed protein product [Hydatigera taeniaeformis]|uniref:Coiled-coil domain-containing protein 153 n=1 Tax=Hydatigena taeniaeformis TaxID=6205 RepID=A0A0R3WVV7_HYDTA|nr:unnamed protein product [Hydatigera taeniaeformis]
MPLKSKKSRKVVKKSKGKRKSRKSTKASAKKKKSPTLAVDPVERQAAKSRALEARLYFQLADISNKKMQLERARDLQARAESELETYKETMEEVSAFTTWQHEHTVERLTDRLRVLTTANADLTQEKNDLQAKLDAAMEESKFTIASRDAEIARLNDLIKESYYKYERAFGMFADRLVQKLTEDWEGEKPFLKDLEENTNAEFLQCGLISTFDE